MRCLLTILCLFVFCSFNVQAEENKSAYTKEQIENLIAKAYDAPAKKFLSKTLGGPNKHGLRIVLVHKNIRYSMDCNWNTEGIQIWFRPNGTGNKKNLHLIIDKNLDGIVDSENPENDRQAVYNCLLKKMFTIL